MYSEASIMNGEWLHDRVNGFRSIGCLFVNFSLVHQESHKLGKSEQQKALAVGWLGSVCDVQLGVLGFNTDAGDAQILLQHAGRVLGI